LIIPHNLIGLIGLFPIAIGIKELLDLRKKREEDDDDLVVTERLSKDRRTIGYLPFLTVATITFSGGEEIGIYTSVFVSFSSSLTQITSFQ
jgi:cadmium resistance protein CadD (predicted permease)